MSRTAPTILTALGASGMALCTYSCYHADKFPGGTDANTTFGLWGTLGFVPAALVFFAGVLCLLIATISGGPKRST